MTTATYTTGNQFLGYEWSSTLTEDGSYCFWVESISDPLTCQGGGGFLSLEAASNFAIHWIICQFER